VIYAVGDLDAASTRIAESLGLSSVAGGRHPGWGTENRIVPLGAEYLELVTVADPVAAAASDFGRAVMNATSRGDQLVGWAVATDDVAAVATRLNLDVTSGTRTRPDGTTLSWRLAGVARALRSGALPFFIEWDAPAERHPGRATADHRTHPRGIDWVEIASEAEAITAWLGESDLPVRMTTGAPALCAVGIGVTGGEAVLR